MKFTTTQKLVVRRNRLVANAPVFIAIVAVAVLGLVFEELAFGWWLTSVVVAGLIADFVTRRLRQARQSGLSHRGDARNDVSVRC
ncbi:hypothetical protein [Candidatus Poriferisodalis sp.]|uniref:hypothetical protein n=1 Tax=Candidatus Poriferisodalis sp. TaxID=3101277 RepID=UPI003C701144